MQQPYRYLRMIEKKSPVVLVGICVYEAMALTVNHQRMPTLSQVANRHKWVLPLICGLLVVHVWFYDG